MAKVLTAMSGGVDSSVATALLAEQGYECIGCTLRLFDGTDAAADGPAAYDSPNDSIYARSVAWSMDIPYYMFDSRQAFRRSVLSDFVDNYVSGRTPNPCIVCNRLMKFGGLYERARQFGCEYIATGHYARIERSGEQYFLKKAVDRTKDQSYVLYFLSQEQLKHTLLPLGELSKNEVRAIALEKGFVNARKPDSQDICFVPDGDYSGFIQRFCGRTFPEGDIIDTEGKRLGRHHGIINYTIGQRKGLGVSAETPLYVKKIDADNNTVVLARAEEMFDTCFTADNVSWISGIRPEAPVECSVRIRYHHPEQPAVVYPKENNSVKVVFKAPVRAITPGQAAVFYDGDTVLGGGTITTVGE